MAKDEEDLVVHNEARSIVEQWMTGGGGAADHADSGDDAEPEAPTARAARLGLGAKYVPHQTTTLAAETEGKIKKRLTKRRRDDDDSEEEDKEVRMARLKKLEEMEDEAESKSAIKASAKTYTPAAVAVLAAAAEKKKKKNKKKKNNAGAAADGAGAEEDGDDEGRPVSADIGKKAAVPTPSETKAAAGSPAPKAGKPAAAGPGEEGAAKAVKTFVKPRKKTRSRQKNIRRDNRPDELKPTYLKPDAPDYNPVKPRALNNKEKQAVAEAQAKASQEKFDDEWDKIYSSKDYAAPKAARSAVKTTTTQFGGKALVVKDKEAEIIAQRVKQQNKLLEGKERENRERVGTTWIVDDRKILRTTPAKPEAAAAAAIAKHNKKGKATDASFKVFE